jgi:Asp-tRNA(Asn)/Glu-tRNA(Gln) amidotransferase A subunit family amidase
VNDLIDGELETAAEMSAALEAGEVTASQLVERALRRAEAWQPGTNAFSQLWVERARGAAKEVDARRDPASSPFAGVPLAIKDLYDVAGQETTGCCEAYRGNVAVRDAPMVQRMVGGGLVMMGKTNQHELAAGGTNLVSACGPTRNPWDLERMTGGSSGGSAAAVAAGVVPWALGSDTGGSIRIPSSLCGLFGLKPTTGRLSIEGMLPLAPSMDCPGPMAATAEDLRTLYGLMAAEPSEPRPPAAPVRVRPLRGYFADRVHQEVLDAVDDTLAVLASAGVEVAEPAGADDESIRVLSGARGVWTRTTGLEFAKAHEAIRDRRHLIASSVVAWMELGESLSAEERAEIAERRRAIGAWFRRQLAGFDALVIPTTPYPAPGAGDERVELRPGESVAVDEVGPGWLTSTVNLAGLPALSVPAGRSTLGLPMGVSFVGHDDAEPTLLELGSLWGRESRYRPPRPPLPGPAGRPR